MAAPSTPSTPAKPQQAPAQAKQPHESVTAYPEPVARLLAELARLPGIGRRSAERLAFHVLKAPAEEALRLARAIEDVKQHVRHCVRCFNFADDELCRICGNPRRDQRLVLVVEQPKDLIAIEQTGMYRGVYHVLLGRLSPLEGIGPADLTVDALLARLPGGDALAVKRHGQDARATPGGDALAVKRHGQDAHATPGGNNAEVAVEELILGLNPTLEGDGTALYLAEQAGKHGVRISRLARGLPAGSPLEFANKAVLADAIAGRQPMQ